MGQGAVARLDDVHLELRRGVEAVHVQVLKAGAARLGDQARERVQHKRLVVGARLHKHVAPAVQREVPLGKGALAQP